MKLPPSDTQSIPATTSGRPSAGRDSLVVRKQPVRAIPHSALVIDNYQRLDRIVRGFPTGTLSQLILGPPGVQKTTTIRELLGHRVSRVTGHSTAWGLYCDLHCQRDRLLFLDDLDQLYAKPDVVALLKCLTEKAARKTLAWRSDRTLQSPEIPQSFVTRSRAIIVCNRWLSGTEDVLAVEDRCITVYFDPSPAEVHARAASWVPQLDPEVYAFIGANLDRCRALSMRLYDTAMEYKRYGEDWQAIVLQILDSGPADSSAAEHPLQVARDLLATGFPTQRDRVRAFRDRTGLSQATFYRLLEQMPSRRGRRWRGGA